MLRAELDLAEKDRAQQDKQSKKLLLSNNPSAKTQYLDNMRFELNSTKKENVRLLEEVSQMKKRDEQVSQKLNKLASTSVR